MLYKVKDAEFKDIEILTSIKSVTMIDDVMDKKLAYQEKIKIKNNISLNIQENYKNYKLIYIESKIIGAYALINYLDGFMIDELYLFSEYRNQGIGTQIINELIEKNRKLYIWVYKDNILALKLFRSLGFTTATESERLLILKYDSVYVKVVEELAKIRLGYIDKNKNKLIRCGYDFKAIYVLQSSDQVAENKVGLCFDQVEYERELISKMNISNRTYFIMYQDSDVGPAHAFLIFKDNNKYYWFENAWFKYRGIHEYDTKEEALLDVKYKFIATLDSYTESKLRIYEFDKPRSGINYVKYIGNAMNGRIIKV